MLQVIKIDTIDQILGSNFTPTTKMLLVALKLNGPSSTKQLLVTLNWPSCDSDRVLRPLTPTMHKGIVERRKYKLRFGGWSCVYRLVGDNRDWLYNQGSPEHFIQVKDNERWKVTWK